MLKAAGVKPPKTWDELKSVALKTTKGNVHGFGISSVQNEEGTFGFLCFLWGSGNTSFQIDNANGIRALSLVRDLVKSGAMPKEVINWTQGDVMNQFISGNLAMMVNGPWQVPTMRQQAPNLKWNVVLLPVGAKPASDLGGENFGVVKGDKVDEAIAFLKFVANPAEMKTYINDFGYIASRKDVAATQFTNDPIMKVFAAQMAFAKPRGPHPRWPEISDALSLAMNEAITSVATPEAAAAKAQKTIDAIVK
jgi:multiple sugar transport system substrate-binding protein